MAELAALRPAQLPQIGFYFLRQRRIGLNVKYGFDPAKEAFNFACVYVDRGDERRVISLRKANTREVKRYARDLE